MLIIKNNVNPIKNRLDILLILSHNRLMKLLYYMLGTIVLALTSYFIYILGGWSLLWFLGIFASLGAAMLLSRSIVEDNNNSSLILGAAILLVLFLSGTTFSIYMWDKNGRQGEGTQNSYYEKCVDDLSEGIGRFNKSWGTTYGQEDTPSLEFQSLINDCVEYHEKDVVDS